MKQTDLAELRELLEKQLHELTSKAGSRVAGLVIQTAAGVSEAVEQSALDYDRSMSLRISDRESKLIRKIQLALDRMEEGTYGICDMCDGPISVARLKARPVTTLCIKCKTEQESLERASGF